MNLITLTLGEYQTNCYLVADEAGNAAVIDPAIRRSGCWKPPGPMG